MQFISKQDLSSILDNLRQIDLSNPNEDETYKHVKEELRKLGYIIVSGVTIGGEAIICRSRCSMNQEWFGSEESISHIKNPEYIKRFNRASPPKVPMFYGAINSEKINDNQTLEVVCISEVSELLTGNYTNGIEYVTTGFWKVTKPIILAAIVHYNDFVKNNKEVLRLRDSLSRMMDGIEDPSAKEVLVQILEFIASEFAKRVNNERRNDYMISSAFSEMVCSFGLDGVIYPAYKGGGISFNVAIKSNAVDNCLSLIEAKQGLIRVENRRAIIDDRLISNKIDNGIIRWDEIPDNQKLDNYKLKLWREGEIS